MLSLYSAKYEDIPKNVGPDEWYLVGPTCSGAVTGCKFEQEHRETGCNESHTQEQKADVDWKNSEMSCHFLYKQDRVQVGAIFVFGVEDCREVFNDAESECISMRRDGSA